MFCFFFSCDDKRTFFFSAYGYLEACGMNIPHTHPRATEINIAVNGTLRTGMLAENGARFVFNNVPPGSATVFPQGAIHFEMNLDCREFPHQQRRNMRRRAVAHVSVDQIPRFSLLHSTMRILGLLPSANAVRRPRFFDDLDQLLSLQSLVCRPTS